MQRGGFPFRIVILVLFVIGTVYLLYLYNTTLGRLRDAELSAERYRREEETKVAQLQEVMLSKDELQEKCDNEKHEAANRFNSLNQQHKMLKSQYDEHEVEQMRLEQESRRLKDEYAQVESQRNQEYQQLKQEKELEISSLKDQIANVQRQNEQLQAQLTSLKTLVQSKQNQVEYAQGLLQQKELEITSLKQLVSQNSQLRQNQQLHGAVNNFQQQQQGHFFDSHAQQQPAQQPGHFFDPHAQQQPAQQPGHDQFQQPLLQGAGIGQQAGVVANMNQANEGEARLGLEPVQVGQQDHQQEQHEQIDLDNQQHQMLPPHNNQQPDSHLDKNLPDVHQEDVKNEHHQVQPPNLNDDLVVKKEAVGAANDNAVDHHQQHEDPLGLRQMMPPDLGNKHQGALEKRQQPDDNEVPRGRNAVVDDLAVKPVAPQGGF